MAGQESQRVTAENGIIRTMVPRRSIQARAFADSRL